MEPEPERVRSFVAEALSSWMPSSPIGRGLAFAYITEAILGFEAGRRMNFKDAELRHLLPRNGFRTQGSSSKTLTSSTAICEGIRRSMSIDDPLLIWQLIASRRGGCPARWCVEANRRGHDSLGVPERLLPRASHGFHRIQGCRDCREHPAAAGPRSRQTSMSWIITECLVRHAAHDMMGHHLSTAVGIGGDDVERLIHWPRLAS